MRVTIEFDEDELAPVIQTHLETGIRVQDYIRCSVDFFNDVLAKEKGGAAIGCGDKSRFASYNTVISPTSLLDTYR